MRELNLQSKAAMGGQVTPLIVHRPFSLVPPRELTLEEIDKFGKPHVGLDPRVNEYREENSPYLNRGLEKVSLAREHNISMFYGTLSAVVSGYSKEFVDWWGKPGTFFLGILSLRKITTVGVGFIVDAFANGVEMEIMKYHGIGLGSTGESSGDTDIETELTTQYSTDNTRATGSTEEGGSANIYRTIGTNSVDASAAIVEHGILSDPAVGSGVLLDRSVFSVINLGDGDSLQTTYDATFSAEA